MSNVNAQVAIQVLPQTATRDLDEVVRIVDAVIAHIASTGMTYQVGAFETTIEGEFSALLALVGRCQEICIEQGASSVMCYVKFNYAPEARLLGIDEKTRKHQH